MKAWMEAVLSANNLRQAWEEVAGKKGAPGIDRVSIRGWRRNWEERLVNLARAVRSGAYRPQRVRYFWVPKPGGGYRRLAILTVNDRVLQRAVLRVVDEYFDRRFLGCSFGYRRGLGVQNAIRAILAERKAGRRWVVDADIEACFDSLDHELLLGFFQESLPEARLAHLVRQWMRMDRPQAEAGRGVLQGAVISPLLCNLYLHRLDQGLVGAGFHPVRYADDFCIFCESEQQAGQALDCAGKTLDKIRLRLEPEKTAITHFERGFDFLGVHFYQDRLYYRVANEVIQIDGDWDVRLLYQTPPAGYN